MNNELTREEKIKYYEDMIEQYKTLEEIPFFYGKNISKEDKERLEMLEKELEELKCS